MGERRKEKKPYCSPTRPPLLTRTTPVEKERLVAPNANMKAGLW